MPPTGWRTTGGGGRGNGGKRKGGGSPWKRPGRRSPPLTPHVPNLAAGLHGCRPPASVARGIGTDDLPARYEELKESFASPKEEAPTRSRRCGSGRSNGGR